jgi:putative transposase
MRTTLVTEAPDMAITGGHAPPGAIFHSGKGPQCISAAFARLGQAHGIRTSTGRTGSAMTMPPQSSSSAL